MRNFFEIDVDDVTAVAAMNVALLATKTELDETNAKLAQCEARLADAEDINKQLLARITELERQLCDAKGTQHNGWRAQHGLL